MPISRPLIPQLPSSSESLRYQKQGEASSLCSNNMIYIIPFKMRTQTDAAKITELEHLFKETHRYIFRWYSAWIFWINTSLSAVRLQHMFFI